MEMQNEFFKAAEVNGNIAKCFLNGVSVKKVEEEKPSITTCLLKIDVHGFFLSYQEKDKEAVCIDICHISYVKDGAAPKGLNKLSEFSEEDKNDIDILSRCAYICFGTSIVEVSFISFDFQVKELRQSFVTCINSINHKYTFRNPSVKLMLYKQFILSKSMLNVSGKITLKSICKCLNAVRFEQTILEGMQAHLSLQTGEDIDPEVFTFEHFYKLYTFLCPRPDIDEVFFSLFGARSSCISAEKLLDFLNKEQRDPRLNEILHPYYTNSKAVDLIMNYESNEALKTKEMLSIQGFIQLLLSKHAVVIKPECLLLSHDMNQPLNHYFINSSHNTYLIGRQVYGKSSVEIYRQILISGCRCVELDCWDGPGIPIITHGKAMCTNVLFSDVIQAIADTAFLTSPYPVILSFENHCSLQQQRIMAEICIRVLGPLLLDKPLESYPLEPDVELPSPEQLKYKVIIKNKKLATNDDSSQIMTGKMFLSGNSSSSIPIDASLNLEGETEVEFDEFEECFDKINTNEILKVAENNNNSDNIQYNDLNKKMVLMQAIDKPIDSENSPLIDTRPHFKQSKKMNNDFNSRGVLSQISEDVVSLDSATTITCLENSIASAEECGQLNLNVKFLENEFKESSDSFTPKLRSNTEVPLNCQSEMDKVEAKGRSLSEVSVSDTYYENYPNWKKNLNMPLVTSNPSDNTISSNTANVKVDQLLSSIINYIQPQPFKGFEYAEEQNKHYVVSSFSELDGLQQCRSNLIDFVLYNKRQFSRIYPKATRVESTNYVPQVFWNAGCQMVALNLQTPDLPVQLNQQKFESNFNSGYLLKPVKYREIDAKFDPLTEFPIDGIIPCTAEIEVISGQFLSDKKCMTYVQIDMFGLSVDTQRKKRTSLSESNLMNTVYQKNVFKFQKIVFPELVLVRFSIYEESDKLLGQRVLPLDAIKSGYRHIPMRSETGLFLPLMTLFVKFSFKIYVHEKYEDAVEELFEPMKYKLLAEHRASRMTKKLEEMLLSDEDMILQNRKLTQLFGDQEANSSSTPADPKRKKSEAKFSHLNNGTSSDFAPTKLKKQNNDSFNSGIPSEESTCARFLEPCCEDEVDLFTERQIDHFKSDKAFLRLIKRHAKETEILLQNHRKEHKTAESLYDAEIEKTQMIYQKVIDSELKLFEKHLHRILVDEQMMEMRARHNEKIRLFKIEKMQKLSLMVQEHKKAMKLMNEEHIEKEARLKFAHSIQQIDLLGKLLKTAQDNDIKKLNDVNEKEISDLTKAQARDSIQSAKEIAVENSRMTRNEKDRIKREKDKLRIEEFGIERIKLTAHQQKRQEKLNEKHGKENAQMEKKRKEIVQLGYDPIVEDIKRTRSSINVYKH